MNYNNYISLIVERIKEESPEKIILFGSYAYGKPDNESDIDLLIIKDISPSKIIGFLIPWFTSIWNRNTIR